MVAGPCIPALSDTILGSGGEILTSFQQNIMHRTWTWARHRD